MASGLQPVPPLAGFIREHRAEIVGRSRDAGASGVGATELASLLDDAATRLDHGGSPPGLNAAREYGRARYEAAASLAEVLRPIMALREATLAAYGAPQAEGAGDPVARLNRVMDALTVAAAEGWARGAEEERETLTHRIATIMGDRQKMLSFVSHELKNPLNTITLSAAVLEQPARLDAEATRKCVGSIRRSASRMNELIENIVELGAIQGGRLQILKEMADPAAVAAEAARRWTQPAQDKQLALEIKLGSLPTTFVSDPTRLSRALGHLIGNAVKATSAGHVTVTVSSAGPDVVFAVEDTGPGIPDAEHAMILQAYGRAAESPYSGAGLGLPIARGIAEALGGSLEFESAPGRGSTFRLRVPAADVEATGG